jgi:hypothetical protein
MGNPMPMPIRQPAWAVAKGIASRPKVANKKTRLNVMANSPLFCRFELDQLLRL